MNESVKKLLEFTDRVLLDVKYTNDCGYTENVGCGIECVLYFLEYLEKNKIPTTLRHVIIPGYTDDKENILKIRSIAEKHSCVDKIELLPFRKICQAKYDNMGIDFPFGNINEPEKEKMTELKALVAEYI